MTHEPGNDCVCDNCFLYHVTKDYCAIDGRKHKGCMIHFIPKDK